MLDDGSVLSVVGASKTAVNAIIDAYIICGRDDSIVEAMVQ
jgi:hypothetical protein